MPLIAYKGGLLKVNGKLAASLSCCCGGPSSDCSDCVSNCNSSGTPLYVDVDYDDDTIDDVNDEIESNVVLDWISNCKWGGFTTAGSYIEIYCSSDVWTIYYSHWSSGGGYFCGSAPGAIEVLCSSGVPVGTVTQEVFDNNGHTGWVDLTTHT